MQNSVGLADLVHQAASVPVLKAEWKGRASPCCSSKVYFIALCYLLIMHL